MLALEDVALNRADHLGDMVEGEARRALDIVVPSAAERAVCADDHLEAIVPCQSPRSYSLREVDICAAASLPRERAVVAAQTDLLAAPRELDRGELLLVVLLERRRKLLGDCGILRDGFDVWDVLVSSTIGAWD